MCRRRSLFQLFELISRGIVLGNLGGRRPRQSARDALVVAVDIVELDERTVGARHEREVHVVHRERLFELDLVVCLALKFFGAIPNFLQP